MRPRIICHMISSIDGRLSPDRWTPHFSDNEPRIIYRVYEEVAERLDTDGWIVGRTTLAHMAKERAAASVRQDRTPREPHVAFDGVGGIAVGIDPHGKMHYGKDRISGDHIVAVVGDQVADEYLAELRADGVSYVFAGWDGRDLPHAMDTLGDLFGAKSLLLEGGGIINGSFLKAGLIDEMSLLIFPGIDGLAGAPTIFEYIGEPNEMPADGQYLRHLGTETLDGGIVWLRYEFQKS